MGRKKDPWSSRIVAEAEVDPATLTGHPQNWRRHTDKQRAAMRGVLDEIGWVQRIIVNRTTGRVVDGHLRLDEAFRRGEKTVPVVYVELTEAEEKLVLATFDPLSALAETDGQALEAILAEVSAGDAAVQGLLDDLRPPACLFDEVGEDGRTFRNQLGATTVVVSLGAEIALIQRERVLCLIAALDDGSGIPVCERAVDILEIALGISR